NELAARCLANIPDMYRTKYKKNIDNTTFSFDMMAGGHSNLNYIGCTPARDFQKMIGESCEVGSAHNSPTDILKESAQDLTDKLSYDEATTCVPDPTPQSKDEAISLDTIAQNLPKFGF